MCPQKLSPTEQHDKWQKSKYATKQYSEIEITDKAQEVKTHIILK